MMMTAAQCLGGVPVPLYQDAVANEMLFVLQDAGIRFVVVEDQEQVDKMLEIRDQVGTLEQIIYDDPRGMRHYSQSYLHDIHELMEMGRIHDRNHADFLNAEVEQGHFDDTSVMLYTSGTTGKPKGVCQTHAAFIAAAQGGVQVDHLGADGDILSYLPMAWVGDHLFSYAQALVAGFTINCPESGDTVMSDLREIGPTCYFAPPRVFESLLTSVMIRMEDAGKLKQTMFHHFMAVAKRCGADILDGKSVGFGDRLQYWLGNLLVYGPLRNVLGMSRIRVAYTAGAAIGPELFRFYRSMGINLKQFYGQTETCAYVCLQPDGQIKFDSVGNRRRSRHQDCRQRRGAGQGADAAQGILQAPGCHGRVDQCRGLLHDRRCRLPRRGRPPEDHRPRQGRRQTEERRDVRPELHREQAQVLPAHQGGRLFRPRPRHGLCLHQYRCQRRRQLGRAPWHRLFRLCRPGRQAEVLELIRECVEQVNADLVHDTMVADSQIHRFLVLHKELDPDDDELTRTRKVRATSLPKNTRCSSTRSIRARRISSSKPRSSSRMADAARYRPTSGSSMPRPFRS
jgi:long-chain acyl-CoA synthetase